MKTFIKRIFLFLILLIGLQIKTCSVIAGEGLSNVTFKANIPPEFETNIMVNLYYVNGTNVNFSLTKNNNYESTLTLEKGNYELDFVSFYGDFNNEFAHNFNNTLIVTEEYQDIEFEVFENTVQSNKSDNKNRIMNDGQITIIRIVGIGIGIFLVIGFLKKVF